MRPGRRPLLRLTKGVHIVAPAATRHAHVLFAERDGRLFFVIPWLGYSLVGTTDTDYHADPSQAAADQSDVEYLVDEARRAFPSGQFDDMYYAYAGVRALVRIEHVSEGKVSRKHALHDHGRRDGVPGIVSVVGGKITGYRAIAEEVGDLVARKLGSRRQADSTTELQPLPGGQLNDLQTFVDSDIWPFAEQLGLDRDQADHLGSVYGSMTAAVLARVERDPRLAGRVCPNEPTILAQLTHAVEAEWALSVGDILLRRTPLGLQACQALDCLDRVVEHVAPLLGWDQKEQRRQAEAYRREIEPMRRYSRAGLPA
jgi:glycerol-3-phosphate dehydrogenase